MGITADRARSAPKKATPKPENQFVIPQETKPIEPETSQPVPDQAGSAQGQVNGDPSGIKVNGCEGVDEWGGLIDMDLRTEEQVSDDGIHFKGSSTETLEPGYTIEQTWDFEGVK